MSPLERELVRGGQILFATGLVDSHSGNMSVLCDAESCLVTRSGCCLGMLEAGDLMTAGTTQPPPAGITSEWIIHRQIYRQVSGAGAVIHCHPLHANALALDRDEIIPVDTEAGTLTGKIPVLSLANPVASEEAAEAVADAFSQGTVAVLLRTHGLFVQAPDFDLALARTSAVEYAARLLWLRRH